MAIALVASATANSGTGTSAPMTVTLPGAAAVGHLAVYWTDAATGVATVTGPTGWTEHVNGPDAGNCKPGLWTRVLDAADITAGSVTATRSTGGIWSAVVAVYSGADGLDQLSAANATTTATTAPSIPAVTPAVANALRLGLLAARVAAAGTAATQTAPPAGWSLVAQAIDASAAGQRRLSVVDSVQLSGQNGVAQPTATATLDQSATYVAYSATLIPSTALPAAAALAVTATLTAGATRAAPAASALAVTAALTAAATAAGAGAAGFAQGFGKPAPLGEVLPPPPLPPDPTPGGAEVSFASARPIVEVGFTTDPLVNGGQYLHWSDPVRGLWDVGLWAPDEVWTDVTPWLQTFSYQRGATRTEGPVLRYDAGTATVVLNNGDGRFHPANLTGPYAAAGRTQVRPMVPVRIRAEYGGVVYDLWRGFADGWDIVYPSPAVSTATVSATDAQKVFGSRNRVALAGPVGTGELPGPRVRRILNGVGWPAADRLVEQGNTPLAGTLLDGDPWAELVLVQDTELGEVYVDAAGKVVFKGRYAVLTDAVSATSQAIFGRHTEGELPYVALVPSYDDADIRNVVRIARQDGVPQEARDSQSVAEFLEKTHERTDLLMQTDTDAAAYAQYLLASSKDAVLRFSQIVVNPHANPAALFPQVLRRDFGDRITVRSRPPGVPLIERDVFIRGIAGEYGGTNRWRFTWGLQPAARYVGMVWDVSAWDSSAVWVY